MNKERRKQIRQVIDTLSEALLTVECLRDEEQECFDNMPEGLQDSDRGMQMQENADSLEEACTDLENVIGELEEVANNG